MKQNAIDSLMRKYAEGSLSSDERTELERLTHKEEVFSAASRRASTIVRRRISVAVAALMVCGAGVMVVASPPAPLRAEASPPAPPASPPAPLQEERGVATHMVSSVPPLPSERGLGGEAGEAGEAAAPVVICNNQCEADSVISDIRKFLSV